MGDVEDFINDGGSFDDPSDPTPKDFFNLGPEELADAAKHSRKPIILSIRKQWRDRQWMSEKQQWVLAFYCYNQNVIYS